MKSDLTVGFLTSDDPKDKNSWSGIYYHMLKSLETEFTNVIPLGPVFVNRRIIQIVNIINFFSALFFRKGYNTIHNRLLATYFAIAFKKKLRKISVDLIFAPACSTQLAFLRTKKPIVYFSDTSFGQINNYYRAFSNLTKFSLRESEEIQQKALKKSKIVIHASEWATNFVVANYQVSKDKTYSIPMGANIDLSWNKFSILEKLKDKQTCRLLFLGVDWDRKGGEIAFETMLELNRLGVNSTLTVCGCMPPKRFNHPQLKIIGFLNKNISNDHERLENIMNKTHFLVLPTKAECAGIVFAEASAFGIPSITTDTGGIASMVENNINGFRFSTSVTGSIIARFIKGIFEDDTRYRALVISSRQKYEKELNWRVWGTEIKKVILDNIKDKSF